MHSIYIYHTDDPGFNKRCKTVRMWKNGDEANEYRLKCADVDRGRWKMLPGNETAALSVLQVSKELSELK